MPPSIHANSIVHVFWRFVALTLLVLSSLHAEIRLSVLFQDGMVLQRHRMLPVWGTASPGTSVTVHFGDQLVTGHADANGSWMVYLDPMQATSQPQTLAVESNDDILFVEDVLVGEVWLASGQSNMEWPVAKSKDADIEIRTANWPLIREFQIERAVSNEAETSVTNKGWLAARPEAVGEFSAVAYYFARDLHKALNVPVGIINSSYGGTRVRAWLRPDSIPPEEFNQLYSAWEASIRNYEIARKKYEQELSAWEATPAKGGSGGETSQRERPKPPWNPENKSMPGGLYNAMIHPIAPYSIAGVIWYQGETDGRYADSYHRHFPALIQGWRKSFETEDLPFYWVQLAAYGTGDSRYWAFLREAQTAALSLPATGQAIAIDVGEVRDVHPKDKQSVGRRLARLALNRTYAMDMVDRGPVFERAKRDGSALILHFQQTHGGLKVPSQTCRGFELAGEDRIFYPANAEIVQKTIRVESPSVPHPVAVRYAWKTAPEANLYNGYDLPAEPFRTDDWPE